MQSEKNSQSESQDLYGFKDASELENYRLHRRFDRMGRLVGDAAMKRLMNSHVMVIGIGGVGSWAAESLVRSGIGKITLVDFDEICITNFNRQLHALQGLVGRQKAEVMADRLKTINPQLIVNGVTRFYNEKNSTEILNHETKCGPIDYVVDAIDNVTAKCHLIAACRSQKIPMITSTGSGGRMDPTKIKIGDLSTTYMDGLAKSVRKILRGQYDFPREGGGPFGIDALYSDEQPMEPVELHYDGGKGFKCVCPQGQNEFFNCDNRNLIYGNASFVTGAFGLFAASHIVRNLLKN